MVLNDHLLPVDPAAQDPLAAVQEVDAVVLDVEADQVAACGKQILTSKYFGRISISGLEFLPQMSRISIFFFTFLICSRILLLEQPCSGSELKDSTHSGVKEITRLTLARGPGFSSSSFQRFFTP